MSEFDEIRNDLRTTRAAIDAANGDLAGARERVKQVAGRIAALDRVANAGRGHDREARERLRREHEEARAEVDRHRSTLATARELEASVVGRFARLSDPREGISQWKDGIPILLMPVRLETRFKDVVSDAAGTRHQLWVRVFPDDCWIDAFDPTLTATEVGNAKAYWTAVWQGGGIEDQERGAWRMLAAAHGSGRASWIVEQFKPIDLASKPTKPRPQDVILTIPLDAPLAAGERAAVVAFWRALWLADSDGVKAKAAFSTLVAAVGASRAEEVAETHRPANFDTPLAAGATKATVNVDVAVVTFPAIATKQAAWSSAPRVRVLPDRFVFIGYEGSNAPIVELGRPLPSSLIVGPDPSAAKDDQIQHDDQGNVKVPDELTWMTDFDRAVDVGMGFRIDLTELQSRRGFDRVLVIGLRLSADETAAKGEIETLFRHHAWSRTGLTVVPQGTPTNNTEATGSGHARGDDPDQSFDDRKAPRFAPEADWLDKRDGQWLAEYLGIDPAVLAHTHHADSTDQLTERAMNVALWPATLGYWMETMMAPIFPSDIIERTREFFTKYVLGAGAVPAIRIGAQPYGILPATAVSRIRWLERPGLIFRDDPMLVFLRKLYPLLLRVDAEWNTLSADRSYTGKPNADPHQTLLDIVGLHSGSVEWTQRYAESLKTAANRLNFLGLGGRLAAYLFIERQRARDLLRSFGYVTDPPPPILDKLFSGGDNLLKGGVVDDKPLSESERIRSYTPDGRNYIQWLIDASNTSIDALYRQEGFAEDKAPAALLYLFLRHALQLGYHDVSVRLHENAGLYTQAMALAARAERPFLHVAATQTPSESRYQPLFAVEPTITGIAGQTVAGFITSQMSSLTFAWYLREQLKALERLKTQSTARLERAFADHIDTCAYRLDAWLLGIVNVQLARMRSLGDRLDVPARQGLYLGAYAWIEELRPENKVLVPVELRDPGLVEDFGNPDEPPLVRDSANQGYVHAPSLNHGVAAAVLRNGFISDASPQNRKTMAVNLTSERVRTALALLEGIRAGQSLSDLLGFQFERGLHDRHKLAEVDKFIYKLRKAFPLRADKMKSTKTEEGVSIESIEARNVIDGLAFVEHMKATGNFTYPFGKTGLPSATSAEEIAINAEAEAIRESQDAVADLALAEGVYQAVLGNYDRVASTYDAYARGNFPPEPDVVRTPFSGIGLTHRVGLHLQVGVDPTVSPVAGVPVTPRAQGEPALNHWLTSLFPPLDEVGCVVSFRSAATGVTTTREVTLKQLQLQPVDVVTIVRDDHRQAMAELDDRVVRFAIVTFAPRPDVPVTIRYRERQTARFSVFELMPLVRHLRRLTSKSRPLKPTDLTLMNEATSTQDSQPLVDKKRLVLVRAAMEKVRDDLVLFQTKVEAPLGDLENRRDEILTDVDDYVDGLVPLLMRAALFAVPQAGWGFTYDFQSQTFAAMLRQVADLVARWKERLDEFDAHILEHDSLPATATNDERFKLLVRAETAVSTVATSPLPATPAAFRTTLVNVTRKAFSDKRDAFANLAKTTRTRVSALLPDIAALLPTEAFDLREFTLTAHGDAMVRFAEDAVRVASAVIAVLNRRLAASKDRFDEFDGAASPAAQLRALENAAKALLGEDFRIIPEFTLTPALGAEIDNALTASRSGALFTFLTNPPDPETVPLDFPVDTWLHGLARVRDKMFAWEQVGMMTAALGTAEPQLDPLQLPFMPNDRWLGLEFPADATLNTDRLLYTAHFATPFNSTARQCGLLLDEWTELIPGREADTGITFHHDRPNCEAPQSMLLVTPADFTGAWQWNDVVDALNETLNFAKRRAIEPRHVDDSPYAPFLPATILETQVAQLTMALELGLNNKIARAVE